MTAPTITFGHGFRDDMASTTGWTKEGAPSLNASLSLNPADIFTIDAVPATNNDESCYWEYDLATNISSDTYDKYLVRYKTWQSSTGVGAQVCLIFTDGTQYLLGSGAADATPQFSARWTVKTGTVTPGKTIDKIQIIANDEPNSVGNGAPNTHYYVDFDFILLCTDIWTFPYGPRVINFDMENNYVKLSPPGRVGDIHQYLGMSSPPFRVVGGIDTSTAWHDTQGWDAELLQRIFHEISTNPWQWFTSDFGSCKVVPIKLHLSESADEPDWMKTYEMDFEKYSLSSGSETTWTGLQWLGVP